jgi:Flp pilus assembly protein protease CpaA
MGRFGGLVRHVFVYRTTRDGYSSRDPALVDWRMRRIPTWLMVPVFAMELLSYGLNGGWSGHQFPLEGVAIGFGLLHVLWLLGGCGGGDVEVMRGVAMGIKAHRAPLTPGA